MALVVSTRRVAARVQNSPWRGGVSAQSSKYPATKQKLHAAVAVAAFRSFRGVLLHSKVPCGHGARLREDTRRFALEKKHSSTPTRGT